MRVTKTIKSYIEKRVREIYRPKMDALYVDYNTKRELLNEILDNLLDKVNQDAKDTLAGTGFSCLGWKDEEEDIFDRKNIRNNIWWNEIRTKESAIIKERDEKIEEIIITLELGGTKEELEEMLNALV